MPNISNSSPGYCILREKDKELDCYLDVLHKIQDEGLDYMQPFVVTYKRADMYKIITKVANVESILTEVNKKWWTYYNF